MNEPAGMSTSEDMARWEALEAEARVRLEGEARQSQAETEANPPAPAAWDAETPSWWNESEAPAGAGAPDPDPTAVAAPTPAAVRPEILVADADPAVGASIEQAMVDRGWSVRRVTHGEVALAEFLRHRPHCFVFDFDLPGLGGLDLLRKLDEYGIADDTRLVAHARQAPAIHVQRAMAAGVDRFLDRPRHAPDRIIDAVVEQLADAGVTDTPTAATVDAPADPAPYTGGIFSEPQSAPEPSPAAPSPSPAPARPDEQTSYRSAFGTGGGPPGRVPKLG